jgi:hypothetical protein
LVDSGGIQELHLRDGSTCGGVAWLRCDDVNGSGLVGGEHLILDYGRWSKRNFKLHGQA